MERAIKAGGTFPELHTHLGNVRFALGDREGSLRAYQDAIAQEPEHVVAHFNMSRVHYSRAEHQKAGIAHRRASGIDFDRVERYAREAMVSGFRILGEGQLSLTKFLLLTDGAVDLKDFPTTLRHVLERADFRTDLFVFANLSMDSLDYAGPVIERGSKGILLGVGEARRKLPDAFSASPAKPVRELTEDEIAHQASGAQEYQRFAATYREFYGD